MQKSNLIAYLRQFTKRDWRQFRKFISTPYFNKREDVQDLFNYLEGVLAEKSRESLNRTIVFAEVFSNEKFDDKKLRHCMSQLLKLIQKYLSHEALAKDLGQQKKYLRNYLRQKGMDTLFEMELKQSNPDSKFEDSRFYLQQYELEMESAKFSMQKKRTGDLNFQPIADHMNIAYISNMLMLACSIQSQQTISKQDYNLQLLPQILETVANGNYLEIPAITLYYYSFISIADLQTDTTKSEQHFLKLRKLIQKNWKLLPPIEMRNIYLFAINYCIKRLNGGERRYIREAFELFRESLQNETLLSEGTISAFTYKNITRLGMGISENEWVDSFLEDYKKYLPPRQRQNIWSYNRAFYYFQLKKYKEAMQLLLQVSFKDVLNNLDARRMLLKSYFELGEFDALSSLLDSFSRYLQRQKSIGYHRNNYINLIRFVQKIINLEHRDKNTIEQIRTEIHTTKMLAERDWLLEKLSAVQ